MYRIVVKLAIAFALAFYCHAASADNIAVQVKTAWNLRSKALGAFLRYELCYRQSAVFHKGKTHRFYPRAFGLGTAVASTGLELVIDIPELGRDQKTFVLKVSVLEYKEVDRLLRDGKKWKWTPLEGWDERRIVVDLSEAEVMVRLTRRKVRREVNEFFARLEEYRKKHPKLGFIMEKGCGWALDVSEAQVDKTMKGIVEARYVASRIQVEWVYFGGI